MKRTVALAGNPNCGKTTLFNELTGSNQYVGNWPGVTVEKKEGRAQVDGKDVTTAQLVADIASDYAWLYENYEGFGAGGTYDLDYIHATNQYQDFAAKLRFKRK